VRPREAIELMLGLIALARRRHDPLLEARGFLVLGVARMRTRDDMAGAEAFRAALKIAMDAPALDIAAGASMNLGVIEMRRGDFTAAHRRSTKRSACTPRCATTRTGSRRCTTWRISRASAATSRRRAPLPRDGGARRAARRGRHRDRRARGAGLIALRLYDHAGARTALAAADATLGRATEWWFQGPRAAGVARASISPSRTAAARWRSPLSRRGRALEAMDVYSAAWFVGECGGEVATDDAEIWAIIDRFGEHTMVQQFVPARARYTALRDMARTASTAVACAGTRQTGKLGETDESEAYAGAASAALPIDERGVADRRLHGVGDSRGATGRAASPRRASSRGSSAARRRAPRSGSAQIDVPV
jgi:hypothetical protein